MSELIDGDGVRVERRRNVATTLTDSVVINHLKACQKIASDHAESGFLKFLEAFQEALLLEIKDARSNQHAMDLGAFQRAFYEQADEVNRYYCAYLSEGFVKFKKRQLNTTIGADTGRRADSDLSLVGHEDLEESIAITTITQRADSYLAEPLWALNQRFAVLNGGERVTEAGNPAAPIQLCESFRKALRIVSLDASTKALVYKVFEKHLMNTARQITEDINDYFKDAGILPHLRYVVPKGAVPESSSSREEKTSNRSESDDREDNAEVNQASSGEDYERDLLNAIRNLQSRRLVSAGAVSESRPTFTVTEKDLVRALQGIQQQPTNMPVVVQAGEQSIAAMDIAGVIDQLKEFLKSESEGGDVEEDDMQTIDLVGMLFEYMLNDENLPDRVKALLSYLHTPFLKIAFIDPGFFEETDHPAKLLLNSLAEAGSRWVGNDGTQQYEIYEKIKETVDRVLKEFDSDIKVITSLLLDFKNYTKNITYRQELMEKRATEKAQGEEKLREVKIRVNDEIRRRTQNRELPSALLLFLLQPWTDYSSFVLLRYGSQSDKWTKALQLIDDVLWCLQPKSKPDEKVRQFELQEDIIASMQHGFDTIGFDQTKGKKLIDAVSSLMKLALQSKRVEPAPQPMRHKLEKIAAEKAGTNLVKDDVASSEEAQMVEKLKVIEFGTWFEFEGGRRLKIAWYNSRTSHYMLVDQMGKRVDMMSGLKLARQMIAGTAKIISGSSKPFFERALENIYQKLNEQAEEEINKAAGEADVRDKS